MTRTRWTALVLALLGFAPSPDPASAALRGGLSARAADLQVEKKTRLPPWGREGLRGGDLAPVMVHDGVLFRHRAPEAREVAVVGEFNGWSPKSMRRIRSGVWRTTVDLEDGIWRYLFVVDGEWIVDPDNPLLEEGGRDDFERTSLIRVKRGEVDLPRPPGFHEGSFALSGSYQRVDRITLEGGVSYENRTELHPRLEVAAGYSFGRERWLYRLGLVQPLVDVNVIDVGAMVYRHTATPDSHRIGNVENSLAAFFFGQDWRDYHEAEGVSAHATAYVGPAIDLTVRWRGEKQRTVSRTTDWSLFNTRASARENPPIADGTLRTFGVRVDFDTRNDFENPTRGTRGRAAYEWAGGELGGDFEFRRGVADFRRYTKLSRGHYFDFRVAGGLIEEAARGAGPDRVLGFAAIPIQERFYLGGLGTMRATRFKSLQGDRMVLGNAEVRVEIFPDFQVAIFADVGDAWIEEEAELDLKADAGIGFQDSDGTARVNFARKVDRSEDSIHVTARIQRMF